MATIFVNREAWESLSKEDQDSIIAALRDGGAMKDGDTLSPADDVEEAMVPNSSFIKDAAEALAGNPACEAACSAAYASAVSRCNLLPHPAARAVCFSAAMGAYALCLRNC